MACPKAEQPFAPRAVVHSAAQLPSSPKSLAQPLFWAFAQKSEQAPAMLGEPPVPGAPATEGLPAIAVAPPLVAPLLGVERLPPAPGGGPEGVVEVAPAVLVPLPALGR